MLLQILKKFDIAIPLQNTPTLQPQDQTTVGATQLLGNIFMLRRQQLIFHLIQTSLESAYLQCVCQRTSCLEMYAHIVYQFTFEILMLIWMHLGYSISDQTPDCNTDCHEADKPSIQQKVSPFWTWEKHRPTPLSINLNSNPTKEETGAKQLMKRPLSMKMVTNKISIPFIPGKQLRYLVFSIFKLNVVTIFFRARDSIRSPSAAMETKLKHKSSNLTLTVPVLTEPRNWQSEDSCLIPCMLPEERSPMMKVIPTGPLEV